MKRTIWAAALLIIACGGDSGSDGSTSDGTSTGSDTETTTSTAGTTATTAMTATTETTTGTTTAGPTTAGPTTADTGDTGTDDTGTTGQPAECPPGTGCVPTPPKGWNGPIAFDLADQGNPIDCEGTYPDEVLLAGQDLAFTDAVCGCDCTVTGGGCGTPLVVCTGNSCSDPDPTCWQVPWPVPLPPALPFALTPGSTLDFWWAHIPVFVDATPTPTVDVGAEPSFDRFGRGCGFSEEVETCQEGAGVCAPALPQAFGSAVCVWAEGDFECPSDYGTKHALYDDIQDDRGCEVCEVAETHGVCGEIRISGTFTELGSAGQEFTTSFDTERCEPLYAIEGDVETSRAFLEQDPQMPTCTPNNPGPIGQATAIDPITVCCQE